MAEWVLIMPKEIIEYSVLWNLREALCRVYPADGYDPVNDYKKRQSEIDDRDHFDRFGTIGTKNEENKLSYLHHPLTLFSSFIGLPNKSRGDEQSWKNLAFNFIGWNKGNDRLYTRIFFRLISPLTALINLLLILPRLVLHITKLFTEFLPAFIMISLDSWINEISASLSNGEQQSHAIKYFNFLHNLLTLIVYPFYFVGRALTSPWMAVRMAWYDGNRLSDYLNVDKNLKKVLSLILALASVLITTVAYTILFPLAIKFVAVTILPSLPGALVGAMGILAKGFAAIGQAGLILCAKLTGLSFIVAAMPELAGIGFLLGLILPIAGAIGNKIHRYFVPENKEYYEYNFGGNEYPSTYSRSYASFPLADVKVPEPKPYPDVDPTNGPDPFLPPEDEQPSSSNQFR